MRQPGPILIAEGYATAATLHEMTDMPVIVAFTAGNLLPVTQTYRKLLHATGTVSACTGETFPEHLTSCSQQGAK